MQRNTQPDAPRPGTFAGPSPGQRQPSPGPGPRVAPQDSPGQRQARGPVLQTHGRTWRAGRLISGLAAPGVGPGDGAGKGADDRGPLALGCPLPGGGNSGAGGLI